MLIEQRIVKTCAELINSGVKMLTLEHGILLTYKHVILLNNTFNNTKNYLSVSGLTRCVNWYTQELMIKH